MRKIVIILSLFVSLFGSACVPRVAPAESAVANQPSTKQAEALPISVRDANVLEAALRHQLKRAKFHTTIFISVSAGPLGAVTQDPSAEFMKRLADLPFNLKPVSGARMPKPGEMETPNRLRGIEDPATGERCYLYWARIVKWESDTRVSLDVGAVCGPLCGNGGVDFYELRTGRWVWVEGGIRWIS